MTTSDIIGTIVTGVTLTADVYSSAVTIDAGASVSGNAGVFAQYGWSVTNLGTITGVAGPAVLLYGGGGITNAAGAQMVGSNFGVAAYGATTVINAGTITGGVYGIGFRDTSVGFDNTLVNSGTIIGNDGTAVQFGAGDDLLELLPGFAFAGAVDGGGGTNTLEFGGTLASTFSGIGSVYTNFEILNVDAGADWTLVGTNSLHGVTLTNSGTLTNAGTINNYGNPVFGAGSLVNKGTISNAYGTGVVLDPGGSLDNQGPDALIAAYSTAVYAGAGTVTNSGTIASTTGNPDNNSAFGVHFVAGGVVTNTGSAAKISGQTGIIIEGGAGTIGNDGTIAGSSLAIRLQNGGAISNYGTIEGSTGIVLAAGGSVTNAAGALIAGASFAVLAYGSTTVIDSGTIVGNNGTAIQFGGGDDLLKLTAGAAFTGAVDGGAGTNTLELGGTGAGTIGSLGVVYTNFQIVNIDGGADWTLTGNNTISQGALTDSGTLSNAGSLNLYNTFLNDNDTFTNTGTLSSNFIGVLLNGSLFNQGAAAQLTGAADGVQARYLASAVTNDGTITSTGQRSFGVYLKAGGSVTNTGPQATISGKYAVRIFHNGAVINHGTIAGAYQGVYIGEGSIANVGTASLISGKVVVTYGNGTVTNQGVITSGKYGVYLHGGGGISNAAGAVITGYYFVLGIKGAATVTNAGTLDGVFGGVSFLDAAPSTLINSGTITTAAGKSVQFGNGSDLLELKAGAAFTGGVDGGAGTNRLEFGGTAAGSITGLGTSFTNFGIVSVDAGAHWALTGTNLVAAGVTLTDSGTLTNTGTFTNAGIVNVTGALVNSGTLIDRGSITGGTTRIGSGGSEIIAARGHANNIVVSSGGVLKIQPGGDGAGIKVLQGGTIVYAGGSATSVSVSSGGREIVAAGATLFAPTVGAGVTLTVSPGGTASKTVLNGGTEIVTAGGAIAGVVTFGANALLSVATTPTSNPLSISGFKATDTLDLTNFRFQTTNTLSFVENAAKTSGVLTISNGALHASVTLFGQHIAGGFHLAPDRAAGTAITYTTMSAAHLDLAAHHP